MHDRPDSVCKKIIANMIPKMVKDRSRILLVDQVLPDIRDQGPAYSPFLDIGMAIIDGAQREESHWRALLHDAGLC